MTSYVATAARKSVVIAAGLRTPWARAGGAFKDEDTGHLGALLARELLARTDLAPGQISEVIVGCVGPPHDQANVARVIALRAGIPWSVPARTVARNCASGIEAVTSAVINIEAGMGDLFLCMGVELMSSYPLIFSRRMTRWFARLARAKHAGQRLAAFAGLKPSFLKPRIALTEGLRDPVSGLLMGQTAEVLARDFAITREQCDRFACQSHERALRARSAGRFKNETAPVLPLGTDARSGSLTADDGIREDQSLEKLGKLKPYFEKPDGIVTVGNSCGITDGACALLVTTLERARALGLQPLARVRSFAWAGLDPARMGLGPVFASHLALEKAGLEMRDVGVVEINEAFAAQVLACAKAFASAEFARTQLSREHAVGELDFAKTNVNGGAIALGHPVGATGARLLLTTAHQMRESDCELGLATLCIGGGQGGAVILERVAA